MKKTLLIITMILVTLGVFAQSQISYMTTNKYKVKSTGQEWDSEWVRTEGPIYIYLDMGFGFASITNAQFDRWILTGMDDPIEINGGSVVVMTGTNASGVGSELHINVSKDKTATLTIIYTDIQYKYSIDKESTVEGYPFKIFEQEEKEKIQSNTSI